MYATCAFRFYEMYESRVYQLMRAYSACLTCLGRNTNVLQNFEIFIRPAHASVTRLMCDYYNKLIVYVQNLQRVEIFHTPGARLGYTLMCDCCLKHGCMVPGKINQSETVSLIPNPN